MARYTRTVTASGAASGGGGGHTTHCIYEWELLANCIEWDCCYSGSLEILVCPTLFTGFKLEMNGMVLNCSSGTASWFTPRFSVSETAQCNYYCCNSYNWVRPWEMNGCQGMRMCYCYCTGGCYPSIYTCCGQCLPQKFVGCIMSSSANNGSYGIHGSMCTSKGNSQNVNQMFACNVWSKGYGTTGVCWECIYSVTMNSGLGYITPRWNAGETCGLTNQIPNWRLYGIRCGVQQEPVLGLGD
tara:strand:+ start:3191 stop:3916 length:726 start_codon:yes stop_codon:yes gene_type:complete